MGRNQEPKIQESKTKTRKRKLLKLGAGTTAALALFGGVGYAATKDGGAHTRNATAVKHETSSSPFEAYNTFAKELIDGKTPVRVVGATVTFSLNGQKDKSGLSTDKLLYEPSPGATISGGAGSEHPLYYTGSVLGVARFQGHNYLYGCDITSKQNDRNKINPNDIYAGCLQRTWGQDGHENYMLFIDLDNPPDDLKILTNETTLNGQLYPGQLFEPQSDIARKLIGPSFSEGHGFEFTYSLDPSQNNWLLENSREIPISAVTSLIG